MKTYSDFGYKHSPLDRIDNFAKIKNIESKLAWGSMIADPDFTIVIPVFGVRSYLKQTLESVRNQDRSNLRVQIVISDNKQYLDSDNSFVSVLKDFSDCGIAYFRSESALGPLNNFNRSVELAKTKYVAMLHDDDLLTNDYLRKIERLLPILNANPDIALIHEKIGTFYSETEIRTNSFENEQKGTIPFRQISKMLVSLVGMSMTGIPSCGFLINKETFLKYGGFNDEYASSGDAFPAAIMMIGGEKVMQSNELWGCYRISDNDSLKTDVCQRFIIQDYLFGEDWMKHGGFFRKMMMSFFRNYRYSKNIDAKVKTFGGLNPDINIKNLDFRKTYKKYKRFGIYRIFYGLLSKTFKFTQRVRDIVMVRKMIKKSRT